MGYRVEEGRGDRKDEISGDVTLGTVSSDEDGQGHAVVLEGWWSQHYGEHGQSLRESKRARSCLEIKIGGA